MKKCKFIFPIVMVAALMVPPVAAAGHRTGPVTNDGRKWRVGYLEGGDYINYPLHLRASVDGLVRLHPAEPDETIDDGAKVQGVIDVVPAFEIPDAPLAAVLHHRACP